MAKNYFYEIVKSKKKRFKIKLYGPIDDIRYTEPADGNAFQTYRFVQVNGDKIIAAFQYDQILVTDRKL
jgi:hypothetical protein